MLGEIIGLNLIDQEVRVPPGPTSCEAKLPGKHMHTEHTYIPSIYRATYTDHSLAQSTRVNTAPTTSSYSPLWLSRIKVRYWEIFVCIYMGGWCVWVCVYM